MESKGSTAKPPQHCFLSVYTKNKYKEINQKTHSTVKGLKKSQQTRKKAKVSVLRGNTGTSAPRSALIWAIALQAKICKMLILADMLKEINFMNK